jgi:hypothetical protein
MLRQGIGLKQQALRTLETHHSPATRFRTRTPKLGFLQHSVNLLFTEPTFTFAASPFEVPWQSRSALIPETGHLNLVSAPYCVDVGEQT